jgi:Mlc titration factor MtfA (ptsG expression regulator)
MPGANVSMHPFFACHPATFSLPDTVFIPKSITKVLQKYYKSITKVLQKYYKSITKVLQKYYKSITKVLQKYYKSAPSSTKTCE